MDRVSWHTYFMNIADVVKTRSLDTKTKVGAVLVSMKDNRIISTGYNSVCAGMNDSLINWDDREHVHQLVIHAETNAILYAQSKYEDAILYSTLSPCKDCIKLLSATKIRKIIYRDTYKDFDIVQELCKYFQIELVHIDSISE
jgi:dCMP deaminase